MKKADGKKQKPMRAEYDFAQMEPAEVGKYYKRYRAGTNVVLLDPDVRRAFPTSERVNDALRGVLRKARAAAARKKRGNKPRPR